MSHQILDMHCDTAYEMAEQHQKLRKNTLQLDLDRMMEFDTYIQVFAAFVDQKSIRLSPMKHCVSLLENMRHEIKKNRDLVALIQTKQDLFNVQCNGKVGAILSIEGGEALEGNLDALSMYYQLGVRLITLTWNWSNEIADGIMEPRGGGLTDFGKQTVSAMEKMGILIDVSHLSERGFWDVESCTQKPFVASHSCVKKLCSHPRNLSDEQIECLIQRRGGMGINFYPDFLSMNGYCDAEMIVQHMEYVLRLGGDDILGLGSDFDGVSALPEDIHGVEDLSCLIYKMKEHGFLPNMIDKILFHNFYRIWNETLL